jgi:GT2 family glycosyltransferase
MAKTKFAAVVVTYKTRDLLDKCLESMIVDAQNSDLDYEIVVVDNASGDGTVEMIKAKYPKTHLIANTENLGLTKALNMGIGKAINLAENIFVLNSDIKVLPGTLRIMLDYLHEHPDFDGALTPLYNPDMTIQMMKTHIWNLKRPDFTQQFRAEMVGTTFSLIRASVFQRIGGYDENYFYWNEDLDWAQRAKRNGCTFMYLPNAGVIHYVSKGSSQNRSKVTQVLYQSNIYYYKKFYPNWAWLALFIMKREIAMKIRDLRKKLTQVTGAEKEAIETAIADLYISRQNMMDEYAKRRTPASPCWEGKKCPN